MRRDLEGGIMFGTNPISKARTKAEGFLVHSIFYTIQGEGPWAGMPTIFLRLAGCNLQCAFCDTEFSEGAREMRQFDLVAELSAIMVKHRCYRIVITGGEPMLQPLTNLILHMKLAFGTAFQIETAGTVWPERFDQAADDVTIVCSPKTPRLNRFIEAANCYYKYIVKAGELDEVGLPRGVYRPPHIDEDYNDLIYVQAMDEQDPVKNAANLTAACESAMKHGYRLSIQMHKLAGLP